MLKFTNGKYKHLGKEKEYLIWKILNGEKEPTKQQAAYVANVEAVYLDRTAKDVPISYLTEKAAVIAAVEATEPVVGSYAGTLGVRR
jgi:hypothetical protein